MIDVKLTDAAAYMLKISCSFKSESKRFFKFFKPQEIVVDQDFRVKLNVKNLNTKQVYPGGSFSVYISYSGEPELNPRDLEIINIPEIPPNESVDITSEYILRSQHAGTNYLYFIVSSDDLRKHYLLDEKNRIFQRHENQWLPFHISTKDEIYQYYGVWFAVGISFVALLLSIVSTALTIIQILRTW